MHAIRAIACEIENKINCVEKSSLHFVFSKNWCLFWMSTFPLFSFKWKTGSYLPIFSFSFIPFFIFWCPPCVALYNRDTVMRGQALTCPYYNPPMDSPGLDLFWFRIILRRYRYVVPKDQQNRNCEILGSSQDFSNFKNVMLKMYPH